MPGRNRTGPIGMGSMTGRGSGLCSGYAWPRGAAGTPLRPFGRGLGRAGGLGNRGRRAGFPFGRGFFGFGREVADYGGSDPEIEKQSLQQEAAALNEQLKAIEVRLAAMEKQSPSG